MKAITTFALAALLATGSAAAGNLWLIGPGTPSNWDMDMASVLPETGENTNVYSSVYYLNANEDFKILTVADWDNTEYGAADGASIDADGEISIVSGTGDNGYGKIQVKESGNYTITVDLNTNKAKFELYANQTAPVRYASLRIVGGVTNPAWSYNDGYVMHRVPDAPYIYRAENVGFDGCDPFFKISAAIKDNWDQKFWFFRDAEDASKMVFNQDGDIKWQVDGTGNYTVEANTATNEITITRLPLTDKLYVVGDACLTGWETDMAPALIRTDDAAQVYSAVLYLAADQCFKFLSQPMWDHAEYAGAYGAALTDGKLALASGIKDCWKDNHEVYPQITVPEAGNYRITVDIDNMEATFEKAAYQENPVKYTSLTLVGDALASGWSIDEGVLMTQDPLNPHICRALNVPMGNPEVRASVGEYKITTAPQAGYDKGEVWYTRDAEDAGKMVLGSADDNKWSVEEPGYYNIYANTVDNTIRTEKVVPAGIGLAPAAGEGEAEYYTLQGIRVERPSTGLYIVRQGGKVSKVYVK